MILGGFSRFLVFWLRQDSVELNGQSALSECWLRTDSQLPSHGFWYFRFDVHRRVLHLRLQNSAHGMYEGDGASIRHRKREAEMEQGIDMHRVIDAGQQCCN